jgi:hypothetical protein
MKNAMVCERKPIAVVVVATMPIPVFLNARYAIYATIARIYAMLDIPKNWELSIKPPHLPFI